jgi:hypothetical protein
LGIGEASEEKKSNQYPSDASCVPGLFVEFNSSISSLERYSVIPFILPLTPFKDFKEEVIPRPTLISVPTPTAFLYDPIESHPKCR